MRSLTIAILWLVLHSAANASETQAALDTIYESARQVVPAKQLTREAPRYPKSELRKGGQAWVNIAYCIDESGAPQNVSVVDSVGSGRFERAAVEAVRRWKFEPALVDGEPTWQSRNQTIISFAIEQGNEGARKQFVKEFRRIGKLIDSDELDAADKRFWRVHDTFDLSLYELSKLWAQRVRYEGKREDLFRLDLALHRATAAGGQWIDEPSYIRLLKLRVQVEVQIGKYREAQRSFRELAAVAGDDAEEVLALRPVMEKLDAMIAGDEILKVEAQVKSRDDCYYCNQSWHFSPVRRHFTVANISGSLQSIEMRCDHKRFESAVTDLVEWHIPEAWGECNVHVYGDPGTTFDLIMLPTS